MCGISSPASCPFKASCQLTCRQSGSKGRPARSGSSLGSHTRAPGSPHRPLACVVWALGPGCPRCSSSLRPMHLVTPSLHAVPRGTAASSFPAPATPFPFVPILMNRLHSRNSLAISGNQGGELPEPSCLPGTCRMSLGREHGQKLWTTREQMLGGLFLPGKLLSC